jgi:hypothetical protein
LSGFDYDDNNPVDSDRDKNPGTPGGSDRRSDSDLDAINPILFQEEERFHNNTAERLTLERKRIILTFQLSGICLQDNPFIFLWLS